MILLKKIFTNSSNNGYYFPLNVTRHPLDLSEALILLFKKMLRPQLFKGWITLSTGKITNQRIDWFVYKNKMIKCFQIELEFRSVDICFVFVKTYPFGIVVIYLVDTDSVIQPLNNWGQYVKS